MVKLFLCLLVMLTQVACLIKDLVVSSYSLCCVLQKVDQVMKLLEYLTSYMLMNLMLMLMKHLAICLHCSGNLKQGPFSLYLTYRVQVELVHHLCKHCFQIVQQKYLLVIVPLKNMLGGSKNLVKEENGLFLIIMTEMMKLILAIQETLHGNGKTT